MKVKTDFGEYNVSLGIAHYSNNNNLAIQLYDEEDGCPFATITTNICTLPAHIVAVDTNNCPWAMDFLKENGLVKSEWFPVQSGFCLYPTAIINLDKLEELAKGE